MKIYIVLILLFLNIKMYSHSINSDTLDIFIFNSKFSADSANAVINQGEKIPKSIESITLSYTNVFYDFTNHFWYIIDDYDVVEKYFYTSSIRAIVYF